MKTLFITTIAILIAVAVTAHAVQNPSCSKTHARCLTQKKPIPYSNLIDQSTGLLKTGWLSGPAVAKSNQP